VRSGAAAGAVGAARVGFATVQLALNIGHWGFGVGGDEQLELTLEAERLGYAVVWASEAYGSDAASVLAWLAARTSEIRLGAAVFQMPARSPAMAAMTAATIDGLSGGRMILGLGSSGPQVAEGWHGQRFARQLARTRDYVAVVRLALARERVAHDGETLVLPLPDGPGKALRLSIAPLQERLPILLAALGPNNTRLAGEIADGVIPMLAAPEHVLRMRGWLAEGAARAGRHPAALHVAAQVLACVDEDADRARDAMRATVALYVGGMGSRERNYYNDTVSRQGFADAAREVAERYLGGHQREAAAALPAELIDAITLCGPRERVAARIAAYRDAGVDSLGIAPMGATVAERLAQLRAVAELAA
jgi:F420-dependent oxidoreductase-like protein